MFQSCNLGSKTDTWCADCAKCLYVYISLSAFLDDETLVKIFGKNMLDCEKYEDMFDGLVLDGKDKPFECVGTKSEVRLSLYMAIKRRGEKLPICSAVTQKPIRPYRRAWIIILTMIILYLSTL